MAVRPADVMAKLNEADDAAVKAAEKKLDDALRKSFDGERLTYDVSLLGNITKRAKDEVLKKYRNAGWNVCWQSDSRDGDYLEFTIPRQAYSYHDDR